MAIEKWQSKNGAASTPLRLLLPIELDDVENIDWINSNQRHQQMNEPTNDITEKNMSTRTTHTQTHNSRMHIASKKRCSGRAGGFCRCSRTFMPNYCARWLFFVDNPNRTDNTDTQKPNWNWLNRSTVHTMHLYDICVSIGGVMSNASDFWTRQSVCVRSFFPCSCHKITDNIQWHRPTFLLVLINLSSLSIAHGYFQLVCENDAIEFQAF